MGFVDIFRGRNVDAARYEVRAVTPQNDAFARLQYLIEAGTGGEEVTISFPEGTFSREVMEEFIRNAHMVGVRLTFYDADREHPDPCAIICK